MACRLLALASAALILSACGSTKTVTVTVGSQPIAPTTQVSNLVAEGAHDFNQFACAQCHGPNGGGGISKDVPPLKIVGKAMTATQLRSIIDHGLGGVPNPQSPDKSIPPLSGADFFHQFNTDKKIIDVIRSGSVLGRAPIVSMPHWGGILSDAQLHALTAYIKTLKTA